MNRNYIIAIVIILSVIVIIPIVFVVLKLEASCSNEQCKAIAKKLYENLNTRVDPCENFYEFACGGWKSRNPRLSEAIEWSAFSNLKHKIRNTMIGNECVKAIERANVLSIYEEILEDRSGNEKSVAAWKAKEFFTVCKDRAYQTEVTYRKFWWLFKSMGGFPLLNKSWSPDDYDWKQQYTFVNVKLSVQPFFGFSIIDSFDDDFPQKIIYVYSSSPLIKAHLEDDNIVKQESVSRFRKYLRRVLSILKSELSNEEIEHDINEIIDFDYEFAAALMKNALGKPKKLTIDEMNLRYSRIGFPWILSKIFNMSSVLIDRSELIYFEDEHFLNRLEHILNSYSNRIIANYIGVQVLNDFGEQFFEESANKEFDDNIMKEKCYEITEEIFHSALDYLYVKRFFDSNTLINIRTFLKLFKAALSTQIEKIDWISDESKQRAKIKASYTYSNDYFDAFQKHAELKRKAELRALNEHHKSYSFSQINDYFWTKEGN
ncbi:hypothetical protein B4U79_18066 [Dinothrombium tinctorium]|uniref:Peptidase M13 N-terminal domain-containing protein n=1 Tax=Dinothrombium tinctorium TaxID=1965070 RepID=A0A443R616_9ACAR|nr:hypothetical protein B4U79_18066 [Dinothrombium tinctorium]